ncbi:MAG: nicotinamide riboside transporter PnuC [Saprospiraceae bacterium]
MTESLINLFNEAKSISWVQWLSFFSGLLYIYFASKNKAICWPLGILSSGLWAYASWFQLHLLSDSVLQIIYVLLGFWGWYQWHISQQKQSISVSTLSYKRMTIYIWISVLVSIGLGIIMKKTSAAFPMTDAAISVFSITATILLIQQKIENWLLWICINLVSIPMFIVRGGHLFAVLFFIYFILSFRGWFAWRKILKRELK